jgi:hypothetical protein
MGYVHHTQLSSTKPCFDNAVDKRGIQPCLGRPSHGPVSAAAVLLVPNRRNRILWKIVDVQQKAKSIKKIEMQINQKRVKPSVLFDWPGGNVNCNVRQWEGVAASRRNRSKFPKSFDLAQQPLSERKAFGLFGFFFSFFFRVRFARSVFCSHFARSVFCSHFKVLHFAWGQIGLPDGPCWPPSSEQCFDECKVTKKGAHPTSSTPPRARKGQASRAGPGDTAPAS